MNLKYISVELYNYYKLILLMNIKIDYLLNIYILKK